MIYLASWIISLIVLKFNFKIKVFGKKNVPSKGAFMFVSNHESYPDPLLLESVEKPYLKDFFNGLFWAYQEISDEIMRNIAQLKYEHAGKVS